MTPWEQFCNAIARSTVLPSNLIPYVLAQAMMESGHGQNELSNRALNFWSLRNRPEVYWSSGPYLFEGADYATFKTAEDAICGYWAFIHRFPYPDIDKYTNDGRAMLAYIGRIFCPPGYLPIWTSEHNGKNYHEVICDELVPQALAILTNLGWVELPQAPAPVEAVAGFGIAGDRVLFGGNPVFYKEAAADQNHLNYSKKNRAPGSIDILLLHGTGSSLDAPGLLGAWSAPNSGYSAHLIVGRDGMVYQAVPLKDVAWHTQGSNDISIGIWLS